jgi:hypothetical protein
LEWVFNEWFVEYMVPGHPAELVVSSILDTLEARGDTLLVRRICPFTTKLYFLSKRYGSAPQNLMRRFHSLMRDPARVRIVEESEIDPLSEELAAACPPEDVYLVETALLSENGAIVTTDEKLIARVSGREGLTLVPFTAFVRDYVPQADSGPMRPD